MRFNSYLKHKQNGFCPLTLGTRMNCKEEIETTGEKKEGRMEDGNGWNQLEGSWGKGVNKTMTKLLISELDNHFRSSGAGNMGGGLKEN